MANDYKKDEGKPPLLDALQPFYPALLALAAMMEDMKHKHQLAGAVDPFNEWRQLPAVKNRLGNALARHTLGGLWKPNEADRVPGRQAHLHATHALFDLLGALTTHLEDNAAACCPAPDAKELHGPAGADWREPDNMCTSRQNPASRSMRCTRTKGHEGAHNNLGAWW